MPDLYLVFFAFCVIVLAAGAVVLSLKAFQLAVLGVIISPWLAAMFNTNNPDSAYVQESGGGTYVRLGLVLIMGIAGLIKYLRLLPVNRGRISIQMLLLLIFILFSFFTVTYSIDPAFTFVRSASFLLIWAFLLGLEGWLEEKEQIDRVIDVLFVFIAVSVFINLAVYVLLPSRAWWWSEPSRLIGTWDHPNSLGSFCMTAVIVVLWKLSRAVMLYKKVLISSLLITIVFLMYFAGSRSSIFGAGLGIILFYFFQKKYVQTAVFALLLAGVFILIQVVQPKELIHGEESGLLDLRGRNDFWEGAFILISESPILGYGYGVDGKVWQDARFYNKEQTLWQGSAKTSLHNGYLSVAIGVGMILFLFWCVILVIPLFYLFRLPASPYKAFMIAIMIVMLIVNFLESTIQNGNSLDSIFFWTVWLIAGKMRYIAIGETTEEQIPDKELLPINIFRGRTI